MIAVNEKGIYKRHKVIKPMKGGMHLHHAGAFALFAKICPV